MAPLMNRRNLVKAGIGAVASTALAVPAAAAIAETDTTVAPLPASRTDKPRWAVRMHTYGIVTVDGEQREQFFTTEARAYHDGSYVVRSSEYGEDGEIKEPREFSGVVKGQTIVDTPGVLVVLMPPR